MKLFKAEKALITLILFQYFTGMAYRMQLKYYLRIRYFEIRRSICFVPER